jgi:hypothetical protein
VVEKERVTAGKEKNRAERTDDSLVFWREERERERGEMLGL